MISSFLSYQSGPPFTPLNGSDPGRRLSGIDALVGTSIRPNLNSSLDLSRMTISDIVKAGQYVNGVFNQFSLATAASPIGNAGRNILRADGINNVDLAVKKTFRMPFEGHGMDLRVDFYNLSKHARLRYSAGEREQRGLRQSVPDQWRQASNPVWIALRVLGFSDEAHEGRPARAALFASAACPWKLAETDSRARDFTYGRNESPADCNLAPLRRR